MVRWVDRREGMFVQAKGQHTLSLKDTTRSSVLTLDVDALQGLIVVVKNLK